MNDGFKAVQVAEGVYWVGAVDWGIRDFHGYLTSRGTTYNAYLVMDRKITLIDTVKAPFVDEMLRRIASVVGSNRISYVVSNHSEMDHSGGLPEVVSRIRPEKVFASSMGAKALAEHFGQRIPVTAVEDGGELSLGETSLRFFETRMLHWPDSMFSWLGQRKILFSQDAFGMHLASSERFADLIDAGLLEKEAAKYYANILLPFSGLVKKLLSKVSGLGLDIEILAPDHGPVWRKDPGRMISLYSAWADLAPGRKAVVVYDTMWGSTAKMARSVAEGLESGGALPVVMPMASCHRSDVATELLGAGAIAAGSPTLNNGLFPTMADVLSYLKGLKPRILAGAAFGSYGWSGESISLLSAILDEMKIPQAGECLKVKYVPDEAALDRCFMLGKALAEKLR